MAQTHFSLIHIQFQDDNFDFITQICKLRRMLDLFRPGQIRNVYQSINSFFKLYKNSVVSEVSDCSLVFRSYRVLLVNIFPWIIYQLPHTKRHFALFFVHGKDLSFYLISHFQEVLRASQVL